MSMYVYDIELISAKWLSEHGAGNLIYCGASGYQRVWSGHDKLPFINAFTKNETIKTGYIYLRHVNVVEGKVAIGYLKYENISRYSYQFVGKSKIYDNSDSEIWKAIEK